MSAVIDRLGLHDDAGPGPHVTDEHAAFAEAAKEPADHLEFLEQVRVDECSCSRIASEDPLDYDIASAGASLLSARIVRCAISSRRPQSSRYYLLK